MNNPTHLIVHADTLQGQVAAHIVVKSLMGKGVERSVIDVRAVDLSCERFPLPEHSLDLSYSWAEDALEVWVIDVTWPDMFNVPARVWCEDGTVVEWPPQNGPSVHVIDASPDTARFISHDRPWFHHAEQYSRVCDECGGAGNCPDGAPSFFCGTCDGGGEITPGLVELTWRVFDRLICDNCPVKTSIDECDHCINTGRKPVPEIVRYADDGASGKFKLPDSEAINFAINETLQQGLSACADDAVGDWILRFLEDFPTLQREAYVAYGKACLNQSPCAHVRAGDRERRRII